MQLSVVVPTMNGRERLAACLDALASDAPAAEVVVVNGPSTDGTTGMVRDREDVDVLVEIAERNINVARNAGVAAADGDAVAFVDDDLRVADGWADALRSALAAGTDVVTGPRHQKLAAGMSTNSLERGGLAGRDVVYFEGGNVAFTRPSIETIDGFDEYLQTGGARDAAHRLAARGRVVEWEPEMNVVRDLETDGGPPMRTDVPRPYASAAELERDWHWKYRALAYRLVKNYGLRPATALDLARNGLSDAVAGAREVVRGDSTPSTWVGTGRRVLAGMGGGVLDGARARLADRSRRRNPNGIGARDDREVARYDRRPAES